MLTEAERRRFPRAPRWPHAIVGARVDVLEIDLQLTSDRTIVVWHGPELDKVRLECASDDVAKRRGEGRFEVGHFSWTDLTEGAWVANPPEKDDDPLDLTAVPKEDNRRMQRFDAFVGWVKKEHPGLALNIELKEPFVTDDLPGFIETLRLLPQARHIVVASNRNEALLERFRQLTNGNYRTNLPAGPLATAYGLHIIGALGEGFLKGRVLESPWNRIVTPNRLIRQVRKAKSSAFVFLTEFPCVRALDVLPEPPDCEDKIIDTIERGADGIMTDRPKRVRTIIDRWCQQNP